MSLLLSVWVLTGFLSLLLQDLLLPTPPPWNGGSERTLPLYIFVLSGANLLALLGVLLTARLAGTCAPGAPAETATQEIKRAMRLIGPTLLTGILSLLRILLVAVGSLPIVLLLGFLLYGAAQGALSEPVEQAAIGAPILLFTLFGFARFGWSVYFTILAGSGPVRALRKSKSLFANNRNLVWLLTAVVLALPVLIALTPTFFSSALPRAVYRGLRYLSSVWSFGAAGVVAVTIGNAREEEAETPS